MKRLPVLALLLALILPVLAEDLNGKADPRAPKGWKRYVLGDKPSLSVVLPTKPGKESQKVRGGSIDIYTSVQGQSVYLAEVINLPVDTGKQPPAERQKFYDAAFGSFKSSFEKDSKIQLTVGKRTPIKISSTTGFQETYSGGPKGKRLKGTLQVVLGGRRGYMLAVFLPETDKSGADKSFLSSATIK